MSIPNFKGYCKSCAFLGLKAPEVCALSGLKMKEEEDYCSRHSNSFQKCAICGSPVIFHDGIIDDGHLICQSCFFHLNSCKICRFGNTCEFETNPSPLPKYVQRQIRQGNMTAVTQVMNPERIHITCEKGCKCYSTENGCMKQKGSCSNSETIYND